MYKDFFLLKIKKKKKIPISIAFSKVVRIPTKRRKSESKMVRALKGFNYKVNVRKTFGQKGLI